eukprot:GHVS01071857.1.p3 GENE.GHVS01071857.1~~GHVS01071857.1.p3  ORF type:complete len:116 (+),score=11.16 GHVS01071857.1:178-525(+)
MKLALWLRLCQLVAHGQHWYLCSLYLRPDESAFRPDESALLYRPVPRSERHKPACLISHRYMDSHDAPLDRYLGSNGVQSEKAFLYWHVRMGLRLLLLQVSSPLHFHWSSAVGEV